MAQFGRVNVGNGAAATLNVLGPVAQVTGSTLTAGTWSVNNGSTLNFPVGVALTTIGPNAGVVLDGAAASFPAINGLNAVQGFMIVTNGRTFTTPGAVSVGGAITVGRDATFATGGGMTFAGPNIALDVMPGGTLSVGGPLVLNPGSGFGGLILLLENDNASSPSSPGRMVLGGNVTLLPYSTTGGAEIGDSAVFLMDEPSNPANLSNPTPCPVIDLGGVVRTFTVARNSLSTAPPVDLDLIAEITNGGLTKDGAGVLQFSGDCSNTYTGTTTVNAGTLLLNKTAGRIAIAGPLVINGGVVTEVNSGQIADGQSVTVAAGLFDLNGRTDTVANLTVTGGTFRTGAGTLTVNNTLTLGDLLGSNLQAGLQLDPAPPAGGGGAANLTSPGEFTIDAGGTVDAAAVVVYGNTNTVSAGGTLTIRGGGLTFLASPTGGNPTLTVNAGATPAAAGRIALTGAGADVISTVTAGTATIAASGSGATPGQLDLGGLTRTFNVTRGSAAADMLVTAQIANGGLRKEGTGILRLAQANTYAGGTTLAGGTLEAAHPAALGTGPVTFAGGTLSLRSDTSATFSTPVSASAPASSIGLDVARATVGGPAVTLTLPSATLGAALSVASGGSTTATGGGALAVSGAVTLQAAATVNTTADVAFNGPVGQTGGTFGFTKTQAGTLTLGGSQPNTYGGATTVNGGVLALAKTGGAMAVPAALTVNGPATVRLMAPGQVADAAVVTLNSAAGAASVDTNGQAETVAQVTGAGSITGGGSLSAGPVTGSMTPGAGGVTVAAGTTLTAAYVRQDAVAVNGAVTIRTRSAGGDTSVVRNLLIAGVTGAWTGRLDLADTALVVDYDPAGGSPLSTVADQIASGRAGGAWTGPGIRSSSASASLSLGVAEASRALGAGGGTFQGVTVDGSAVLVRLTRIGDANIDGSVNGSDLSLLLNNFGATAGRTWQDGDFNYDRAVNGSDLSLLLNNFGGSAGLAALTAEEAERIAALGESSVPEPGGLAAVASGLAAVGLVARRRRGAGMGAVTCRR